jgi:hypothetical protein
MCNSRLISEKLWEEKDFVEIGRIIYQQIPSNHPLYERLQEIDAPLRNYFCEGIQLGQTWGLVRTDLSASALYDLTDGLSDVFYSKILNTYDKDSAPFAQAVTLHELLGKTLRFVLTPEDHNDS